MRSVWLNGERVDPAEASVSIDNVLVRFGEGLFETMYGVEGEVPRLTDHLARICRSAGALGLEIASHDELATAVGETVGNLGAPHQRVRLSAAPGLVLVEAVETVSLSTGPRLARAAVVPNSWFPGRMLAEHKTVSYGGYRLARRRAQAAGATIALLAGRDGRLGEADAGNLFAVVGGELITPPVDGLLPGVARAVLLSAGLAREGHLTPTALDAATELFATNAVQGVTVLSDVAQASWSRDTAGPLAMRAHDELTGGR